MADTTWTEGMPARLVEHDDDTRQPKPGGKAYLATVTHAVGMYVRAEFTVPGYGLTAMSFYAESGWASWDGMFTWRLLPAGADSTGAGNGALTTNPVP